MSFVELFAVKGVPIEAVEVIYLRALLQVAMRLD